MEKTVRNQKNESRCYLLIGREQNWKISLEKKVWGFTEWSKGLWNNTKEDELLAFYVTKPNSAIIGFGKVKTKFVNDDILWVQEKEANQSLWRYKISFEIFYICDDWEHGIPITTKQFLQSTRSVIKKEDFLYYVKKAKTKWGVDFKMK